MSSNYPIDMEAAKNTKLFKKFMESKNKSTLVNGPKIQNIEISVRDQPKNQSVFTKPPARGIHQVPISPKFNDNFDQVAENFRQTVAKNQEINKRSLQSTTFNNLGRFHGQLSNQTSQYSSVKRSQQKSVQKPSAIRDEGQYQKKYEKLAEEYNELKQRVSMERKQNKKEMIKMQEQIDMLQKKIFQLRNRQDELILENKRLKQKSLSESKQKQQFQDANRQLTYQVQQLKDMLDGQENSTKKREDEASHWRKINDDLKQRIKQLQLQTSRLKDLNNMMERQKYVSEKEVTNKQQHLNDMREKINSMITQNGVLRDQIFHITSKLYHLQQENKSMKVDLRRHSEDFPMSYLQQQLQNASRRQQQSFSEYQNSAEKSKIQHPQIVEKKTERRRGEFARQRGIKRPQTNQQNDLKPPIQQNFINQKSQAPSQSNNQQKEVGQTIRKLQQLNQQLQKLKDMKATNGSMRRQKINIERQIMQLQQFLKSRQ